MGKYQRQQDGNPQIKTWHALAAGTALALFIWFTSDHTPEPPQAPRVVEDIRVDCSDPLQAVHCLGEK